MQNDIENQLIAPNPHYIVVEPIFNYRMFCVVAIQTSLYLILCYMCIVIIVVSIDNIFVINNKTANSYIHNRCF